MMLTTRKVLWSAVLIVAAGRPSVFAQQQPPPPVLPPPGQTLTAQQLDDLVAPIALYPDPLVSQILVASTYPLELVEAGQWLEKNPNLTGTAIVQAAEQQNWDPSVQALVVFPDLMKRLNQDITWTSNLGNAFLNQQADVMDAVQRMRVSAQQAGKLSSNQQQTVTTTYGSGPPVIEIQPANPQIIYVPYYNPVSIWGPSYYYPYANWYYPPFYGGAYFGFGFGVHMGVYFGAGWGGWGAWGWAPYWGNRTVIVNNNFIHNFNHGYGGGNPNGVGVWSHNAVHRQGVAYTSASVSNQYASASRASRSFAGRSGGQPINASVGGAARSTSVNRSGGRQAGAGVASNFASSSSGTRQFAPRSTSVNRGSSAQGGVGVASSRGSGGAASGFTGGSATRSAGSVNRGNGGIAGGSVSRGVSRAFSSGSVSRGNSGGFSSASVSRGGGGSVRGSGGSFGGGASRGSGGGGVSRGGGGGGGNRGGGGGRR